MTDLDKWFLDCIGRCKTNEGLDCIRRIVKQDQNDNQEYTLDYEYMRKIRRAFNDKQHELKS